jgi:hypothetical protein
MHQILLFLRAARRGVVPSSVLWTRINVDRECWRGMSDAQKRETLRPPNGRELSGTPDERRKLLPACAARSGAQPRSGVRSYSWLGGAQRRLFLNECGR